MWRPGFQGRLWCSKSGYGGPGSGHGCPGGMDLVLGLHHVSQRGNQGEFGDGGASIWASPCEFGC